MQASRLYLLHVRYVLSIEKHVPYRTADSDYRWVHNIPRHKTLDTFAPARPPVQRRETWVSPPLSPTSVCTPSLRHSHSKSSIRSRSGSWRTTQADIIGFEEFALLRELAEVALPDILDRRHVHLLVCAHEDERCEVRRVHVRVGEATAEGEDLLDVAFLGGIGRVALTSLFFQLSPK